MKKIIETIKNKLELRKTQTWGDWGKEKSEKKITKLIKELKNKMI